MDKNDFFINFVFQIQCKTLAVSQSKHTQNPDQMVLSINTQSNVAIHANVYAHHQRDPAGYYLSAQVIYGMNDQTAHILRPSLVNT
jgi:hypothetical protein